MGQVSPNSGLLLSPVGNTASLKEPYEIVFSIIFFSADITNAYLIVDVTVFV